MKLIDAAEIIRAEATKRDAFVAAADALAQIGSIEQATTEAQERYKSAINQAEGAAGALIIAEAEVETARAKAYALQEESKKQAESVLRAAQIEADIIIRDANSKVDYKTAELSALNESVNRASDQLAVASSQLESLQKQIAQASVDYQKLLNAKAALA